MKETELEITMVKVKDLMPYAGNAKLHPHEQVDQIAKSIEEFGNCDPIAAWHNADGEMEIIEGHGRLLALKKLGVEECPVIFLDHLTDEQRRAYTHVHNKLTMNSGFDLDILSEELKSLDMFDMEDFGFSFELDIFSEEDDEELYDEYSQNIGTVHYEPKQTDHEVCDLYSLERPDLDDKIQSIKNEELREMFELRKAWFTEFNFAKIADYYAYQATPEEQRVFEALGMVLLDRDQLIENGFADIVGDL